MIYRKERPTEVIIYIADEREENLQVRFSTSEFAANDEGIEEYTLSIVRSLAMLQDTCEGEFLVVVDGQYHNVKLKGDHSDEIELVHLQPESE